MCCTPTRSLQQNKDSRYLFFFFPVYIIYPTEYYIYVSNNRAEMLLMSEQSLVLISSLKENRGCYICYLVVNIGCTWWLVTWHGLSLEEVKPRWGQKLSEWSSVGLGLSTCLSDEPKYT